MDKITININTNGQLPLVPMDNNNDDSDQFDISVNQDQQSSSSSSSVDESKSSSQTNESPESLNSTVSSSSTISIGRKLIKPEISLDFLDLSDDEENCDSENSESSEDFTRDVSLSEENFPNSRLSTIKFSSKSFNCQQNHRHSHRQHFGVKRQSSLDSSDSISWDESGESVSSSSGYSSLPCNLIDNVYVHEADEVNCPFNLSLTFTELGHIRKALAREELDSMSFTQTVREQLIRGKLCSTCLKTRFKLFGPWADCCRLCERPVCSRCSSNVQINAKRYNSIPIQLLVPNNNQRKIIKSTKLNSSSSSSTTTTTTTTVIAKIKVTDGHHHEKQSSINTGPTSLSSSSSSSSSLNHHNQMKGSKYSRLRLKSLPWIRKTSSSHSNISDEDNPSTGDDNNNNHQHSMLIKLCLDCELFFLSMLTI